MMYNIYHSIVQSYPIRIVFIHSISPRHYLVPLRWADRHAMPEGTGNRPIPRASGSWVKRGVSSCFRECLGFVGEVKKGNVLMISLLRNGYGSIPIDTFLMG